MSPVLALVGTFLLSLFVTLLATLQLADYFGAGEELTLVLMALPVFVLVSMLTFIVANIATGQARTFNWIAIALALLAFAPLALPWVVPTIGAGRSYPFTFGIEGISIALEFIVPALLAVLVQWGLVRRRWRRMRGEDELTRWPWMTTIVAGLAILNPLGLEFVGQAIANHPDAPPASFARTVVLTGAAVLIVAALIECLVRSRMLGRRLASDAPAYGISIPG